jgi:hypothetical protein
MPFYEASEETMAALDPARPVSVQIDEPVFRHLERGWEDQATPAGLQARSVPEMAPDASDETLAAVSDETAESPEAVVEVEVP